MRGRSRATGLVLLLTLFAAACTSTTREKVDAGAGGTGLEVASGIPSSGATDVGSGGTGAISDAPATATGGSAATGRSSGVTSGSPSTAGGAAAGSGGGGGTAGAAVPMGAGVTEDEIRIGIEVAADINRATAAVGAQTSNPEEGAVAQAVIDHLNAEEGGIAGRQIVPVYSEKDATQGTWETHAQVSCSRFTEDDRVFVAIDSSVGGNDSLAACLAQRGVPLVEQNYWPFDAEAYGKIGRYLYQPARMIQERWVPAFIDGLVSLGFFGKDAKIGIVRFDQPVFERQAAAMKTRLAQHGLSVAAEAATITPHGVSDFGTMGAQIGNAIVSFQSRGVTHVLMAEYNGQLPFFFLPAADSQGYKPVYGFHSNNLPNTQAGGGQAPQQLVGSMVVGWMPANDVADAEEYRGGSYAKCQEIGKDSGGNERGRRLYVSYYCESLLFLKAALDQAAALTPEGLEESVSRLGTSFDSAFGYATRFFPGRHDGGAAVRYTRFDEACECYLYANDRIVTVE